MTNVCGFGSVRILSDMWFTRHAVPLPRYCCSCCCCCRHRCYKAFSCSAAQKQFLSVRQASVPKCWHEHGHSGAAMVVVHNRGPACGRDTQCEAFRTKHLREKWVRCVCVLAKKHFSAIFHIFFRLIFALISHKNAIPEPPQYVCVRGVEVWRQIVGLAPVNLICSSQRVSHADPLEVCHFSGFPQMGGWWCCSADYPISRAQLEFHQPILQFRLSVFYRTIPH